MIKKAIGDSAGIVWQLLCEKTEELSVKEIRELTGLKESAVILALGWLGRENKVMLVQKGGMLHAQLSGGAYEMYY